MLKYSKGLDKKMRMSRKKSNKTLKIVIIASTLALLLLVGGVFAYKYFTRKSVVIENGINYSAPSDEEKSTGDAIKQQGASGSDPVPEPTPPASTTDSHSTVGVDITALNQSSGTLYVRTLIQTVTSSGTCSLSMVSANGKTYTASSSVQAGPSSSTCQGFNIPVSSLENGNWSVTISFQNDTLKGSATKDITIQ